MVLFLSGVFFVLFMASFLRFWGKRNGVAIVIRYLALFLFLLSAGLKNRPNQREGLDTQQPNQWQAFSGLISTLSGDSNYMNVMNQCNASNFQSLTCQNLVQDYMTNYYTQQCSDPNSAACQTAGQNYNLIFPEIPQSGGYQDQNTIYANAEQYCSTPAGMADPSCVTNYVNKNTTPNAMQGEVSGGIMNTSGYSLNGPSSIFAVQSKAPSQQLFDVDSQFSLNLLSEGELLNPGKQKRIPTIPTNWYEPGSFNVPFNATDNTSTIYESTLTGMSTVGIIKTAPYLQGGFCTQHANDPVKIQEKCNNLNAETCASTGCCVLLGGVKCVAGNEQGPMLKTSYSNFLIPDANKDFYYYQGKCFGNCNSTA